MVPRGSRVETVVVVRVVVGVCCRLGCGCGSGVHFMWC